MKIINLNIYLFISYLIIFVKLNCFSWKKKQKIKSRLHLLLGAWKNHGWLARCICSAHSPTFPSLLLRHRIFTYVTWRAAHATKRPLKCWTRKSVSCTSMYIYPCNFSVDFRNLVKTFVLLCIFLSSYFESECSKVYIFIGRECTDHPYKIGV